MDDILNPRRARRAALRYPVEVQLDGETWTAETEDLGQGGCQLVTPRVVEPGTLVKLAITAPTLGRTLAVAGRVIWARPEPPARLGIVFEPPGTERAWLGALVDSSPRLPHGAPDRLSRSARLYLGRPPERVVDFSPLELDILRRVGPGTTVDALARSFGAEFLDRTRGALFTLVARRCLVFDEAAAGSTARWRPVLDREGDRPPPTEFARRALGAGRSLEAQRLYDEALGHIGSGRLQLALERLRDALRHSPDDAVIASTAKRIARWA